MRRDGLRVERVLETALTVADVARSKRFYEEVLGLAEMVATEHFAALDAHGGSVLLLFEQGSTAGGAQTEGGWIPPHDAHGHSHLAFAVPNDHDLEAWVAHLGTSSVAIESRVTWPGGGTSVYFRDPDGHSVELATPGIWPTY
jgi:catechol 2,3-dioxygenase-like lactoylglutathione lyase family enzyme